MSTTCWCSTPDPPTTLRPSPSAMARGWRTSSGSMIFRRHAMPRSRWWTRRGVWCSMPMNGWSWALRRLPRCARVRPITWASSTWTAARATNVAWCSTHRVGCRARCRVACSTPVAFMSSHSHRWHTAGLMCWSATTATCPSSSTSSAAATAPCCCARCKSSRMTLIFTTSWARSSRPTTTSPRPCPNTRPRGLPCTRQRPGATACCCGSCSA